MGLLEIFNSVFFVPNFQLPNALVTAAARLGCVSEVKRATSLLIPDSEFPMLNITLRFNREWEMGFKKRWEKESVTQTTSMRAERLAGMCLLSGGELLLHFVGLERTAPVSCLMSGMKNCGTRIWGAQRREGAKVDFFALRVRARHLELGHFSRKSQEWEEGEIEMEKGGGNCGSVAAAEVTLDHCNWRSLIDLSQQMMCRQEWCKYILCFISFTWLYFGTGHTHTL